VTVNQSSTSVVSCSSTIFLARTGGQWSAIIAILCARESPLRRWAGKKTRVFAALQHLLFSLHLLPLPDPRERSVTRKPKRRRSLRTTNLAGELPCPRIHMPSRAFYTPRTSKLPRDTHDKSATVASLPFPLPLQKLCVDDILTIEFRRVIHRASTSCTSTGTANQLPDTPCCLPRRRSRFSAHGLTF